MVGSGCQVQNAVSSWDGEDASARSGDSREVVATAKTLWGNGRCIRALLWDSARCYVRWEGLRPPAAEEVPRWSKC